MKEKDIRIQGCELFYCPILTRVPLKFGPEITTRVISARASVTVSGRDGRIAKGLGETPLSVAWVWPSDIGYEFRLSQLKRFCELLRDAWRLNDQPGHALEIGHLFIRGRLKQIWEECNGGVDERLRMPWLAALVCNSLFDIAVHDAYGIYHGVDTWETYTREYLNHDLSWYYSKEYASKFAGLYPADFFVKADDLPTRLKAWHLVGAKDAVTADELTGGEPQDGYPVLLTDWILRDGLKCLKIKLTGLDPKWDYDRMVSVGTIAVAEHVDWLSADFNCTVQDPAYVCGILDRLLQEQPRIYAMLLYVEQPFPYDIERYAIDVRSVSSRKPLFMDESAHDWQFVAYGRALGWTGVALKTCKTMTGALLTLCWAKSHGMTLMVQDLTNPMLAQIPHVRLAAYAGTIMGVESNAMQFYPEISRDEARVHPGLFTRRNGELNLNTLGKTGMGYRADEIEEARIAAGDAEKWVQAN
ncbi:MAG: enolase C-terminal domain-like protein [Treponemataceae bacterium]